MPAVAYTTRHRWSDCCWWSAMPSHHHCRHQRIANFVCVRTAEQQTTIKCVFWLHKCQKCCQTWLFKWVFGFWTNFPSKLDDHGWSDTRTVACSQTSRRQVTRVRMVHRTLMSQRCHVFCLCAASAHLKSTRTSTGHASTVPPHVKPTVLPSSRQLYGYQPRWTYANSRDID